MFGARRRGINCITCIANPVTRRLVESPQLSGAVKIPWRRVHRSRPCKKRKDSAPRVAV